MEFKYDGHSLKAGVYKLTNTKNGKFYVGSTYQFKRRWTQHLRDLEKNRHTNTYLQNAFNQDGTDSFIFEVIEVVEGTKQERLDREQVYLDKWHDKQVNCYNLGSLAQSREGKKSKNPEETRKKKSEASKRNAAYYSALFKGKHHSPSTEFKPGHTQITTEETRKKLSVTLKGRKSPMTSKVHSTESRQKIKLANQTSNMKNPSAIKFKTYEWLYTHYIVNDWSQRQIAKHIGISQATVRQWIKECHVR